MSNLLVRHILRGLLILLVQVLVLKRISLGSSWFWQHAEILIYPVIILLLPFRLARQYVILIGFCTGLMIDVFYNTIGVHAFALTATAYIRGILLSYLEPRGGYQLVMSPTHHSMGLNWLMTYSSIAMLFHILLYEIAEVFTFIYIGKILLKTSITFILSMAVVTGYHLLFNPRK